MDSVPSIVSYNIAIYPIRQVQAACLTEQNSVVGIVCIASGLLKVSRTSFIITDSDGRIGLGITELIHLGVKPYLYSHSRRARLGRGVHTHK